MLFTFFWCYLLSPVTVAQSWMSTYDFVYLDEILQHAKFETRYAGEDNFIGSPIDGYPTSRQVMTKAAAEALALAEKELHKKGYGLKIFDSYRPQRAVNHFMRWAKVAEDTLMKANYYPEKPKDRLFDLGYISSRSGHSRGSTLDLTIYHLASGNEVDMGGPYDFFGERSHHNFTEITDDQKSHRLLLKDVMSKFGFRAYHKEWWHYTLRQEPYPNTFFDHVVPDVSEPK